MEYDPYDMAFVGKVVKKQGEEGIVDFGGVRRNISLSLVDAKEGDWVLVHLGYAIKVLREDEVEDDLKRKISAVVNDGDEES
jgi:hydrogenase assembly chaperone HypC/HupF